MQNKKIVKGVGATLIDKKAYLLFCTDRDARRGTFTVRQSDDGINFEVFGDNAKVVNFVGPADEMFESESAHVSVDDKRYYLTYTMRESNKLHIAQSKNLIDWEKKTELDIESVGAKIVSDYFYAGRRVMFGSDGDALRLYVSDDLKVWKHTKYNLIEKDGNADKVVILDAMVVDDGIFVLYADVFETSCDNKGNDGNKTNNRCSHYKLYGALFHYGDPTKLLWKSNKPIYDAEDDKNFAQLFGAVLFDEYLVSYWMSENNEIFLIKHFYNHQDDFAQKKQDIEEIAGGKEYEKNIKLERPEVNPILSPDGNKSWESLAVYNPTAIEYDGTIHIIYRADGDDLKSVWGYALTEDGINIEDRFGHYIFSRFDDGQNRVIGTPIPYTSGNNGGGGAEDPRAVLIDGEVYITFTAFDGWSSVRVALTSIALDDLINQRWNWKKTRKISPPGEINKNWVIFPEKINGKFAVLHSFVPEILIDYFDSLDELDGNTFIKSNNTRPIDYSRDWDSWFRGVGPAPIKTGEGWLIIYHAMDYRQPDRYRIGALLLDLNDPTIEICRSSSPILEPEEHYENDGHKWGVVYSCGAVIKDDTLFVYYGGADKFTCVATASVKQFLDDLKKTGNVKMLIK